MKVYQNDIYGVYYDVNGDPIDQRVVEVSDTCLLYTSPSPRD